LTAAAVHAAALFVGCRARGCESGWDYRWNDSQPSGDTSKQDSTSIKTRHATRLGMIHSDFCKGESWRTTVYQPLAGASLVAANAYRYRWKRDAVD